MTKLFILTLSLGLIFFSAEQLCASSAAPSPTQAMDIAQQHHAPGNLSMDDWLNLKPREVSKRTGQKMGFFQRLMLKIVQKKMKKQMRKSQKTESDSKPNGLAPASFILGLLGILSLIVFSISFHIGLFVAFPLGIMAVILGMVAQGKGDKRVIARLGVLFGLIAIVFLPIVVGTLF